MTNFNLETLRISRGHRPLGEPTNEPGDFTRYLGALTAPTSQRIII